MPDGADFPTADEAQRPLPPEQGSEKVDGRSRLVKALVKPARTQVVVALILALVGFAGVTQVRANEVDDSFAGVRQQDLIDILNGLAGTTQRAERELARLEQTRDDLQSDSSRRQAALDQAENEAATQSSVCVRVRASDWGESGTGGEQDGSAGGAGGAVSFGMRV